MDISPLTLLPAKARKALYIAYGALSIGGIGVTAYYTALPDMAVPDPVIGGLAVLGALAAPFSVLAGGNVQEDQGGAPPAVDGGGDGTDADVNGI